MVQHIVGTGDGQGGPDALVVWGPENSQWQSCLPHHDALMMMLYLICTKYNEIYCRDTLKTPYNIIRLVNCCLQL